MRPFVFSVFYGSVQCSGHNGGRPSAVVAQVLQRPRAHAPDVGAVPDDGFPEPHIRMGSRPPGAPQVLRHGRRPAQLVPRVFLLSHGLADGPQTPGRDGQRPHGRHGRPGSRPHSHVAKKVRNVDNVLTCPVKRRLGVYGI